MLHLLFDRFEHRLGFIMTGTPTECDFLIRTGKCLELGKAFPDHDM